MPVGGAFVVRRDPLVARRHHRIERLRLRRLGPDLVQADVHADPVQPRPERGLALELAEAAVGANEDVLREIARVLVVPDEAVTQLIDVTLVPRDQRVERLPLPRKAGFDQLGIRWVRHHYFTAELG